MTTWNSLYFQDASSPIMEQLIFFYEHTMTILILILSSILYFMMSMMFNKFINSNLLNQQNIEMIWTVSPLFLLIIIAIPSIHLLYLADEISSSPLLTIKAIGHQWFWSYEYTDFKNIEFDSYMMKIEESKKNSFRLLDVDNNMIVPMNSMIRLTVSSSDVIHSWAMPSLGKKIDAVPGRLNQINLMINRPGLYFGQCSEICGANHSFMPIVVEAIPMNNFLLWINSF
nr:cytochrome c oxidase subunit II [Dimorphopteryx sp. 1 GYN-2021]